MLKYLFILLVFIEFTIGINAQVNVDSILNSLSSLNEIDKVNNLVKISKNIDIQSSLILLEKAESIVSNIKNNNLKAKVNYYLGVEYNKNNRYEEAFKCFLKSLELSEKDNNTSGKLAILKEISSIFVRSRNYVDALKIQLDIINTAKGINDTIALIGGYIDLANMYNETKMFTDALKSLDIAQDLIKTPKPNLLFPIFMNRGVVFFYNEKYTDALKMFKETESILNLLKFDSLKNENRIIINSFIQLYANITESYIKINDFKKAEEYINKALTYQKYPEFNLKLDVIYDSYAKLLYAKKDYANAIKYLVIAEENSIKHFNLYSLKEIYSTFSLIYKSQGNTDKAYEYLQKSTKLEEEQENKHTKVSLAYTKVKLDYEALIDQNKFLESEQAKSEREVNNAMRLAFIVILILLIMIVFVVIIYNKNKKINKLNQELKGILNTLPDIIYYLDSKGNFISVLQQNLQDKAFMPPEEFLNKNVKDIFNNELSDQILLYIKQTLINGECQFESSLKIKGHLRYFNSKMAKVLDDQIIVAVRDITDLKIAEMEIKESEEKYRLLVENSYDIIYTLSIQGEFLFISDAWNMLLGSKKEEFINKSISEVIHPDDIMMYISRISTLIENNEKISGIEYRIKDINGNWKWHSSSIAPIFNISGIVTAIQGVAKDITQLKYGELQIKKLSVAIEQSPSTIVITDQHGNIEYVNPKFTFVSGYTLDEVKGKNPKILKSGKTKSSVFQDLWKTILAGETWNGEFINLSKNGKEFIEQAIISPILDDDGEIINFLAIKHDISGIYEINRKLNQQNDQLNILINNIPASVYFKDINLNYIRVNNLFAKAINRNINEIIGYSDSQLNIPKAEYFENIDRQVIAENSPILNFEDSFNDDNGKNIWHSTSKVPYRDEYNNPIGIIGIVQDITYYKNTELKLKELNSSKDRFFSIIAHDIKNPLGSSMQLAKMLHEDYHLFSEEERIESIEVIKKASVNLYSLLENLLEWSRSQQGKIEFLPEYYDIKNVFDDIYNLLLLNANQKHIELINQIEKSIILKFDSYQIKTVIRNLISNAIKFTPNNGKIIIGYNDSNAEYTFYVRDNGRGMTLEIVEKLFRIDVNVVSSPGTNNEAGTGLGLILCKEFIEKHKGRIWVESEINVGSTFYFTIPK